MNLFHTALASALATGDVDWGTLDAARVALGIEEADDPEVHAALQARDPDALRAILDGWNTGERLLLERDRAVLKRAMKAYRKRLKVTLLDAESSVAGGPMSAGRESNIVGMVPPERYPDDVWQLLARQGRLVDDGRGTYGLPPGG